MGSAQTPDRFVVVADPSHVDRNEEAIVGEGERYWTVEKSGSAAALAYELDERAA